MLWEMVPLSRSDENIYIPTKFMNDYMSLTAPLHFLFVVPLNRE